MKKAKKAILVPKGLKNKKVDFVAKYLRPWVHVYECAREEIGFEALELEQFYDDIIIVMKISK